MSQTANEAKTTSSSHQYTMERDSSFIPFALLAFIGLAGIAAWLGQPMLCDLCIAEVFFISNKVMTNGASRLPFKSRAIETPVEVILEEKEVKAEVLEIIEGGQDHSKKADIPNTSLPAIEQTAVEVEEPIERTIASEVTVDIEEKVDDQREEREESVTEVPEIPIPEPVITSSTISSIPEEQDSEINSAPRFPVNLSVKEEEVATLELPTEVKNSEIIPSNTVHEHIEYTNKKPRRVSFATPPTPPVSPPREPFAIPAGLRLPPVPIPASILTPPLSPQIPPLDFFVGIDEEVIKKDREERHSLKIDDDWEDFVNDSEKPEAQFSLDHSRDANSSSDKAEQVAALEKQVDVTTAENAADAEVEEKMDTKTEEHIEMQEKKHIDAEREKQLRQQILEAFEDDMPFVSHVEDVATEISKKDTQDSQTMESSMVVVTAQEASPEKSEVAEESRSFTPDSPTLPPLTEVDEPTTISLSQQKPVLIILTPETEESRIIYDANNSRLPSFDSRAAVTEPIKIDVVTAPVIVTPTNKSNIVFSNPFSPVSTEPEKQKVEAVEKIEEPLQDIFAPSPTTLVPENGAELIRGPYIEADDEDEPPIPHVVPEVGKRTTDELMDEITVILQEDTPKKEVNEASNVVKDIPETAKIISETAPEETVAIEPATAKVNEIIYHPKEEEVSSASQSNILPTLLVTTTPMIPENEELVIPERKSSSRPSSPISKVPSRPSTAKTSNSSRSEPAGSSSSIDFSSASSSPLQRSPSAPGSVVRTANSSGDSTLFSSSMTNANAPTTPAATQIVDQKEILPKGKESKRLTKIEEELDGWVDVAADVESYTVLIEKENHYTSENQYTQKTERHANDTKSRAKAEISELAIEKSLEIKPVAVVESTPKRPYPTPLQIQTPPKTYNPVPEMDRIPRMPSSTHKQGGRKVHFNIDDMVAPDSPMFILPIPPSTYGDRPGSKDSAFSRPASRDSAFSSLSCLARSPDNINFPFMPTFPSQAISARMEPTMLMRDIMPVNSGMSETGYGTAKSRPSVEVVKKYSSPATLEWGNSIDLERGTFLGESPKPSYDFARDRDISGWDHIIRDEAASPSELQRDQSEGTLLPLHNDGNSPRRKWTLLRALSIPFSAFRASTDSPRSPTSPITPNSATYPRSPESSTFGSSPRETTGFFSQFYPLSPSTPNTPASPNYPNTSLISPTSVRSPVDPIEPIIPRPENQPLPIRFLKKLSPKGLITGATGAARKAWGLVKYLTSPTPAHAPVPAASGVVERKQSMIWLRGLDDVESGSGVKMEAGKNGNEGILIDFGDDEEDRRRRAREAGRRAALEGVEELREVVVIPIPVA